MLLIGQRQQFWSVNQAKRPDCNKKRLTVCFFFCSTAHQRNFDLLPRAVKIKQIKHVENDLRQTSSAYMNNVDFDIIDKRKM